MVGCRSWLNSLVSFRAALPSHPMRGVWIGICIQQRRRSCGARHTPCGVCGLEYMRVVTLHFVAPHAGVRGFLAKFIDFYNILCYNLFIR